MPSLCLILVLACSLQLIIAADIGSNSPDSASNSKDGRCRTVCTVCQSLRPARISQVCSASALTGCSCPEFAFNWTLQASASGSSNSCPVTEAASRVGFCPFGQRTDPVSGCPLGACRPAPGCLQDANSRPLKDCRAYCPAGYATDANGCPLCRCRCDSEDVVGGQFERRCAAECAAAGATHEVLPAPAAPPGDGCPLCLCRAASTIITNQLATPEPPPAPLPQPCLLRCPNSCGQYGYSDAAARDERGCVRDCSCKCPPRQGCPSGERCLRWEIDRFGCQVCSTCSGGTRPAVNPAAVCITQAQLDGTPAGQQTALINSMCPAVCSQGSAYLISPVSSDSWPSAPCLSCSCQTVKPAAPARTAPCPSLSLEACLTDCPSGNATVSKDADGCYACSCLLARDDPSSVADAAIARPITPACPPSFTKRCPKSCGPYGYETDPATGCRQSCRCNCPKRSSACGCFYGSRQDAFGCDTCECVTASEYLEFLSF